MKLINTATQHTVIVGTVAQLALIKHLLKEAGVRYEDCIDGNGDLRVDGTVFDQIEDALFSW